jgi:hypothetical protein
MVNAIVGRMRGLGLGQVLDLATTTDRRGVEWITDITARINIIRDDVQP